LVIDHVAKTGAEKGRPDKPWGSVFKYNVARSVIRVTKGGDGTVTLNQTKSNDGVGNRKLHLVPEFKADHVNRKKLESVRFTARDAVEQLVADCAVERSLDERILSDLSNHSGGTDAKTIAAEIGVQSRTVSNRLSRLRKQKQVERLRLGVWSLPIQTESDSSTADEISRLAA
jgi:hypothetical protein